MSKGILGDSLQKQIERGEVWYWSREEQGIDSLGEKSYLITTGSKPCSVIFEILAPRAATIPVSIWENPTSINTGSIKTLYNMRRDSTNTISTTLQPSDTRVGGEEISQFLIIDGVSPTVSPLNRQSGLILKANEEYVYEFENRSGGEVVLSYSVFLREL